MIVADSNLIAACILESAATESALKLRAADDDWHVPRLWRYEVANILSTMIRARGLSSERASLLFNALTEALSPCERDPMAEDVFALVAEHGITGYDAQFVALAKELRCVLYTQDRELLAKFPETARPYYVKRQS